MSTKTLIKNNLFILIGGNLSSLLNYLLNLILLRVDKGLFNEYTIVSSIALILFVPSLVIFRVFGTYGDKIFAEVKSVMKKPKYRFISLLSLFVIIAASFFIIRDQLPNKSYFTSVLMIILVLGVIVVNMYRGMRQFKEDFV